MKVKSPKEPIILSEKSSRWLEEMLKRNEKRNEMTETEKKLYEGAKTFDEKVKSLL